jgi:flagellar biosynthesis chaperone FliJ
MNAVEDLLRIKQFRENRCEVALGAARHALVTADVALDEARRKLVEFTADCTRRERAMYADLCSRLVQRKEIDEVGHQVEQMRKEIVGYGDVVTQALERRSKAAAALETARQEHATSVREREKFTELSANIQAERSIELTRREDTEMEEVRIPKSASADSLEHGDATSDTALELA